MRTPSKITKPIQHLAKLSGSKSDGVFVPIRVYPGCIVSKCHINVADVVKNHGGEAVNGWVIWEAPKLFLQSEFHCVWKDPDGNLVDVSPDPDGEKTRLFFQSRQSFTGFLRPGFWHSIGKDPRIKDVCEIYRSRALIQCQTRHDEPVPFEDAQAIQGLDIEATLLLRRITASVEITPEI